MVLWFCAKTLLLDGIFSLYHLTFCFTLQKHWPCQLYSSRVVLSVYWSLLGRVVEHRGPRHWIDAVSINVAGRRAAVSSPRNPWLPDDTPVPSVSAAGGGWSSGAAVEPLSRLLSHPASTGLGEHHVSACLCFSYHCWYRRKLIVNSGRLYIPQCRGDVGSTLQRTSASSYLAAWP